MKAKSLTKARKKAEMPFSKLIVNKRTKKENRKKVIEYMNNYTNY